MSDNLRDRIAAVLDESLHRQKGIDRPDRFKDWIDNRELADAVIRELGLRREDDYDKFLGKIMGHRYITEWMADD